MDSCNKEKDLLNHLTSKSKEEFIQEYTSYDEATRRDVCFAIFAELRNAVISSNIPHLTILNKLIDNISSTKLNLQKYYNHSGNIIKDTNLVILACKHNTHKSLQYLFNNCNFLKNIHCTLSPYDKDDLQHNAFYYAICLNNSTILQVLTGEWHGINSLEIDELLSQAYEELKLKNVALSEEVEAFVDDTLIKLRFYTDDSADRKNVEVTVGDIQERIDLVLENINLINAEYKDFEVDEKFLYITKFITKNIHILKRYLKSTYDRLPWEEIEFCLISFIKSCTTHEEIILLYKSELTKENILCHLCNFAFILKDVKIFIENANVYNLRRLPIICRDDIVKTIIQNNPQLKTLYDNYTDIIDVYSLNQIKYYTDLAISANSSKKEEQLIIIRAIQVIGEYMKNTLESPKLSTTTSELLLQSLQNDTKDIVKNLRNSLSHLNSLSKRTEIEANTDITFFTNIQKDITKINIIITGILYNLKVKRIRIVLKNIVDSSGINQINEVRGAVEVFKFVNFDGMILETETPENYSEVEELVDKLSKKISDKTSLEIELFNEITGIINVENAKLKNIKSNYLHGLLLLKGYSNKDFEHDKIDHNQIRGIKCFAKKALEYISLKIESYNLKQIVELLLLISMKITSRLTDSFTSENVTLTPNDDQLELLSLNKEIRTVNFEMVHIKWVEELKHQLKESGDKFGLDCAQKEEKIIPYKGLEEQLTQKLSLLQNILNKHSERLNSKKIQTILEMLLLDIMLILGSCKKCFNENLLYLDDNLPLLTGKNLRNHLAHGNNIIDILSLNASTTLLSTCAKLTKDNINQGNRKIGKIVAYDSMKLKKTHSQNIVTIINQRKMFTAIAEGNFQEAKNCIKDGADVRARTTNLWTALHFAAKQSNLKIVKFLLDHDLKIDAKDINQQSALHIAAIYGSKNFIEFFIENHKIIIDDPDYSGRTLLHLAAQNGHKEIIELLYKNKASTNIQNLQGISPLHFAVQNGHTEVAKILLRNEQHVDENQARGGYTSLHIAAERGHIEIVKFLLENNANVNAKNDCGGIPLHMAALNGYLNIAYELISKGSDINSRVENGSTALHYAVENNHEKVVKLLIKQGADINVVDKIFLNTPLMSAAIDGFKEIIEILLKNNADVNKKTIHNMTSLHFAATSGHLDIVDLLLKSGAEINCENTDGCTALHLGCYKGHIEIVKLLLKRKSNLNARAKNNETSLHFAAASGNLEVVQFLLLEGADVNSIDANGCTPLHVCCNNESGNEAIAKLLVEVGANIYLRNKIKRTPLEEAIRNDFSGGVEILMKAGVNLNCINDMNFSALDAAACVGSTKVVKMLLNNNISFHSVTGRSSPLHIAIDNNQVEIAKIFIQKRWFIDARSTNNQTPLCCAVRSNLKEIVEILLANGADINVGKGLPLQMAIAFGHKNIAKILLSHRKINLKLKDTDNFTFLHTAALFGDKHTAEVLLSRGSNANVMTTKNNVTPLLIAAIKNHKDIVEVLLANKANVNVISKEGNTSLHMAVGVGGTDVVNLLLNAGANSNIKDKKNRLAIGLAVAKGHLNIVKMLLEYTDVNTPENGSLSLLHIAAQEDHLEIAKYLIEKGANIHARNNLGSKPIHIAARDGSHKVLEYLFDDVTSLNDYGAIGQTLLHYSVLKGQLEMVKYLIDKKFNINLPDMQGETPLHLAGKHGFREVVETLLNNGANYKSVFNKKPVEVITDKAIINLLKTTDRLYEAVKNNNEVEAKCCILEGAVVNIKNSDNVTPLHQASCKGFETIIELLLQNKANPNMIGKGGCAPLHYAASFGHTGIVRKLLSHGAIYDVKSEKNKIPLDFAKHQNTIALLKLVDESFKCVQNGNSKIIDDLNKIKDIDTVKAVMNARNKEDKTIVVAAIQSDFPKIKQLKQIFQDNDVLTYLAIANDMKAQENFQEALDIYKIILVKRGNIFGPDDPAILDIQYDIATILYKQQKYTKALNLYEEIYAKQQTILGINNEYTLSARSAIALVLHRLGKQTEALIIFEEVSKRQRKLLGLDNFDVLKTYNHMALVLDGLGRYDEALKINYMIYEKYKEKYGIKDPLTLVSQNNIAMVLNNQGNHDEAFKLYTNVYESRRILFGPTHSDTLRALHNMVTTLSSQQKFDEALQLYQTVYDSQKSALGPWHIDTIKTHINIANILFDQGKFNAVLKIYKESLEQAKTILGPTHPTILNVLYKMEVIKQKFKMEGPEGLRTFEYLKTNINKAAASGDKTLMETLLINGTDVNTRDSEGRTPIDFAAGNNHLEIVLLLIQYNADVTCSTNNGITPLHTAASKGNKEIINVLLNHVKQTNNKKLISFIDARATGGLTALHVAAKGNFEDVVKILLEYGAAYNFLNDNKERPSDLCTAKNLTVLFKLINDFFKDAKNGNHSAINKLQLMEREIYISVMNARNKEGHTLVQVAMVNKHNNIARKLLELLKASN